MKKIALINPASKFLEMDGDRPPLNLAYLASQVRKNHEVRIFDFSVEDKKYLLDEIINYKPEIIGFTATTPIISEAINLRHEIGYMADFECISIIGGVHATIMPDFCKKYFDYIICGEGDYTFSQFCDLDILPKYKIHNSLFIDNINGLFPSRDLLPMNKYTMKFDNEICTPIITSRGCPYNCVYCSNILGKKVRLNSAENVIKEIKSIVENFGITSFYFLDDVFTINRKRIFDICDLIKLEGLNIKFRMTTRINLVDRAILSALKAVGLKMVCYGLESGSDRILKFYNKGFTINDIRKVVRMTQDLGIKVRGFWMKSHFENNENKKATRDLMQELGLQNDDIYNLTIYPGSKLWKDKYGDRQDFSRDYFKNLYHGGIR